MKNLKHFRRKHIVRFKILKLLCLMSLIYFATSCDDFVDVDLPKNQLTSEVVFEDAATAEAALRNIYAEMRDSGLVSVLSLQLGLYADEFDQISGNNGFYDHTLSALNSPDWWSNNYNLIYEANAIVEGVENSTSLSLEDQNQLKGEALFIRAYLHALLVELYGPIPYIRTTDYIANTTVSRMQVKFVYDQIISDLLSASDLLDEDITGERIRPYEAVSDALLARIYLYTQQWNLSEAMASRTIDRFVLEPDLNKVFLKNSSETIWQFKPQIEGNNAGEGTNFIFLVSPGNKPTLTPSILNAFETSTFTNPLVDQRRFNSNPDEPNWIKKVEGTDIWYHVFKYKESSPTFSSSGEFESKEYSIIFRLAEQYLIRAEARAHLGNIEGAQSDINMIRNRAGLGPTMAITTESLLDAILHERQVELFSEQGHRWFDLKRTGKVAEVLSPIKSGWRDTDILFPIPESEILLNPNLLPQNDGY